MAPPALVVEKVRPYCRELEQATYFLVQDESQTGPWCVPFQNFGTTTAFIEAMERACSLDASSAQIASEMSRLNVPIFHHQYALVHLKWSGVKFMMRRGSDDWKALADRIEYAWAAKGHGELGALEIVIEVKLRS